VRVCRIGFLAIALCLCPGVARTATISLSNEYLRSWNGVIVHQPGASFSSFIVNQSVVNAGPEAALAHDLGFARVDAVTNALSLHPESAVDARNIASFGYDYAIAEASTNYEADLQISGGTGTVQVLVTLSELVNTFTNEPGFALTSLRTVRIDGPESGYGFVPGAPVLLDLEYDALYRVQMSLTAYSRATSGRRTSHSRDLVMTLIVVPEPATAGLLAAGLALIGVIGSADSGRRKR
jgi:hypothetical protein